jgi:N6-adenosine-specific RNA methylase IME4
LEGKKELTTSAMLKLANQFVPKNGAKPCQAKESLVVTDLAQLSGNKFGCIYVDPPWKYQNQGTRASTDNHYKTMSVEDICQMPIGELAQDKCHLHLWTTNAFLFECPKIFEAWGFEFKSSFVWVKPQMGIGNYWRNSHEIMLLGVRGGQTAISKSEMSWINSKRGAHSAKPRQVREMIQRLSPGPYLELFGRYPVEDWTVYGDQVATDMLIP